MDDKGSVGKISVSSDSVSTLNSEDFVLVSRLGDETPSSTNNGSDDEKTGLKVRMAECRYGHKLKGVKKNFRTELVQPTSFLTYTLSSEYRKEYKSFLTMLRDSSSVIICV